MYIPNELKVVNNNQYSPEIRENFLNILEYVINNIISEKKAFDISDFYASYFDEFELKTNCHEEIFNTIYLEINQPNNYKPSKILKKSVKKTKIQFPELYYTLEEFLEDLNVTLLKTLDSNNIVWKDEYSVCLKSTVLQDDKSYTYSFRIIPCITYYNEKNVRGIM